MIRLSQRLDHKTGASQYSDFSQTIALHAVDSDEMERAFKTDDPSLRAKVLPLLDHELQHFYDHVATVWGRENLAQVCNAFNIRYNGLLAEYRQVTEAIREIKRQHYTDYYTEYTDRAFEPWDHRPWRYQFTGGAQITSEGTLREDRPIMFTRFSTFDGGMLCRVPFSLASLLEVRAMAVEMARTLNLLAGIKDDGLRAIEERMWSDKMIETVFDASLTMYTVAAHYLSNVIRTNQEIVRTYQIASFIAGICLNLPRALFPKLRIPDRVPFRVFGDKNESMRANCDRGYLYAVLIANGRDVPMDNLDEWADRALIASGPPPFQELGPMMEQELASPPPKIIDGPATARLNDCWKIGEQYRQSRKSALEGRKDEGI